MIFFDDHELEPPPSTKRVHHPRDLQAAAALMGQVDDEPATLVATPTQMFRLLADAFADRDISEDITVEREAPRVAIPSWLFDRTLDASDLGVPPSTQACPRVRPAPRLERGDRRAVHLMVAAWAALATALAWSSYLFLLPRP